MNAMDSYDAISQGFSITGMIDGIFKMVLTYTRMMFALPAIFISLYITGLEAFWSALKYHIFASPARPLHNDIVLVIGSDTELGRAISTQVVRMRGTVVCVDSSKERGEAFVKSINDPSTSITGPKAFFFECDVTRKDLMATVIDSITKDIGDISVLINCMEHSLIATYYDVYKLVLPIMKGNKKGTLVFMRTSDFEARHAIHTLYETISQELKETKARVSTVFATVYPKISATADDTSLFNTSVIGPDAAAQSILEGVSKKRKELFLPGYMVYCSFWMKLLPPVVTGRLENILFTETKAKVA